MRQRVFTLAGILFLAVFCFAGDKDGLKNTFTAGLALTDGNSETMQMNAALITEGKKEGLGSLRAGVEGNYGESKVDGVKETTVENARLFANTKKTITPRTFASLDGALFYDDIAEIDYRGIVAPGLGLYLLKNEKTAFYVEVAPAYVWEKVDGVSDDYPAFRFAERIDHEFSPAARVWQSLEFLPKADDFKDYLLNAELGAEAALNSRVNLRIVLQNKYDSTPGEDLEKNDLMLIAGMSLVI